MQELSEKILIVVPRHGIYVKRFMTGSGRLHLKEFRQDMVRIQFLTRLKSEYIFLKIVANGMLRLIHLMIQPILSMNITEKLVILVILHT